MALIKSVRGFTHQFGDNIYLSENATVIGDVMMGRDCSVWRRGGNHSNGES